MILEGQYDLYITNVCNLHCENCSVLDWNGKHTISHMSLDDVKEIIERIKLLSISFRELKIVGGEPTLHKQFPEIVEYLLASNVYEKLSIVTNGLNLTKPVIKALKRLGHIYITVYPGMPTEEDITERGLLSGANVTFWNRKHMWHLMEPGNFVKHRGTNAKLNWSRCEMTMGCKTITKDALYYCTVAMNERKEGVPWNDAQELQDYAQREGPLDLCGICPWPPKGKPWKSLKPKVDNKNYNKAMDIIRSVNV